MLPCADVCCRVLTYAAKAALKAAADLIADSLNAAGWAVCDHFAPAELVANVRRELAQLIPLYEPSEIWVGKEAGVGAQVYLFEFAPPASLASSGLYT